jgi:hypothetical protein
MRAWSWALASLILVSGCDDTGEPALSPPADFTATPSARSVALSWKNPDGARVAIVRFPYGEGREVPADTLVVAGRTFDVRGVVLYVGTGDAFLDRTVGPCEAYEYHALTLGNGAEHGAPAVRGEILLELPPPGTPPTTLEANIVDGGVHLGWGAPSSPDDFVRVSRAVAGDVVDVRTTRGAGEHVDRSGLVAGETYRYVAAACNTCGACSEPGPEVVVSIPVDFAPSGLTIDPNGATVDFAWTAPRGSLATMRLFAREGGPVEGPDDPSAEVLYEGDVPEAHVAMTTFLPDVFEDETRYHFAVYACAGSDCSEGAAADYAFSLGDALRGGGHVVYFRHGEAGICVDRTDLGTADETETPDWWKSCARSCDVATAEQLSAQGFADAQAAGLSLRNAGVPFEAAFASEYCRAVETAEWLQIVAPSSVRTRADLTPFVHGTEATRCEATLLLLGGGALGAPDRNAVIVGHPDLSEDCALLDALDPGDAAVIRPTEDGPIVLARIAPDAWSDAL